MKFDLTKDKGIFHGKWALTPGVVFPDTLVDFGPINADGQYAWVLELQCVEVLGEVAFIGANFYSSLKDKTYLKEMEDSWHAHGLD